MNCFQMSTFARGKTTVDATGLVAQALWIAFKWVPLQEEKQHNQISTLNLRVVNCFQMSTFARGKTTNEKIDLCPCALWIAFKWVPLQEEKQRESYLYI